MVKQKVPIIAEKKVGKKGDTENLRLKAELLVKKLSLEPFQPVSETETLKLIHELKVNQIELELQKEELQSTWSLAEGLANKYSELYNAAVTGYFTLSPDGSIVNLNPSGAKLLGKESTQLVGSRLGFFVSDDTKPIFNKFLEKTFAGKSQESCDVAFISNEGLIVYVQLLGIVRENSEKCHLSVVDITDRINAENRINISTKILTLLNTTTSVEETLDLTIGYIKKAFGYHAVGIRIKKGEDYPYFIQSGFNNDFLKTENILNKYSREGEICMDENGSPCLECTCGLVISGLADPTNPLFTEGGSFWTNDSSLLLGLKEEEEPRLNPRNRCIHEGYQSVALIPIHCNENIIGLLQLNDKRLNCFTPMMIRFFESLGEMLGVGLMRKQAEEEIHRLNETLEQRIAERTLELSAANKELAFHLKEVEQFSYVSNHDLQEPLRTLIQFTELLNNEYSDKLDEDGRKYIQFIAGSAIRMKVLVKDILEYTLLGKESLRSSIDCHNVVETVLHDLNDSIRESNAKIIVHKLPTISGFGTELRLLFQNLLVNAIKYQKKDRVPEINITAETSDAEWLFKISDNGIGIDEKYYDKIFIIFQRLHNRSEFEGTGIGLAHCKKIVEMHNGRIWVESILGLGSTFLFTIPIL